VFGGRELPVPEAADLPARGHGPRVIVYRDAARPLEPRARLRGLAGVARRLAAGRPGHDGVVGLLVAVGELEAAVADALAPAIERPAALARRLRQASLAAGRAVRDSWAGSDARPAAASVAGILAGVAEDPELPRLVRARPAEGYAHYGLLPETYLEAARRFARRHRPADVACIGLRGIGTSLSAVVAAGVEATGARVETWTVRPRGHPFARRLAVDRSLARDWARRRDWWFLVVDEGPGLSGSSFAAVADGLRTLGVPEARIVLFPSWSAPPAALRPGPARRAWTRLPKALASFEEVWVDSGRLAADLAAPALRDLSAGAWRPVVCPAGLPWPAVHAQHERRKFLIDEPTAARPAGAARRLCKFVGLGERGELAFDRACRLADAGFAPEPLHLVHGFLVTRFVSGRPLATTEVRPDIVDRVADYLAFVRRTWPATPAAAATDALLEMVRVNVAEALGRTPAALRRRLGAAPAGGGHPVALDARMLPHEWLSTASGLVKTDGTDHHDDHFFPGCVDSAWDVAGAAIELGLGPGGQAHLVRRYRAASGDRDVARRLPFYRVAYLAQRVGYTELAARTCPGGPDRARFRRLRRRYTALLRRELEAA